MKKTVANNPFTITFGKQPNKLISRHEDVDMIVSTFCAQNAVSQSFMIEGLRGSGKTVLMTTVAKELEHERDWIIINLNPTMDLLSNFAIRLNEECKTGPEILNKSFNISAAGFGVGLGSEEKSSDYVGIIEKSFKKLVKKNKKVLITVDEVIHDENMKIFASQFQIFVRQDYPIFLIMTGLYENIYKIQNDPSLTFLLRSPKVVTGPLSILQITRQYKDIFEIDEESANSLARITKGYAFAFQALGVSYWSNSEAGMPAVLEEFDELLDDFVYRKIWSSLTSKEREIVMAISESEVKTGEICKAISMNNSTFSRYRENLTTKGILESSKYGYVSLSLPRFYEIVKNYNV